MNEENGRHLWERFTTAGMPRDTLPFASFASRYCLNYLEHNGLSLKDSLTKRSLHQFRNSDLVRATGIRYHLDISIQPKSAYKLRILMFQSPKGWDDLTQILDNDGERVLVGDGEGYGITKRNPQGGFNTEGVWFTKIRRTENGAETAIHPGFSDLFEWQRKTYDHLEYNQRMERLKISHPHVRVIYDQRLVVTNRTKLPKRKVINKMYKTSTTWLYPPVLHDNKIVKQDDRTPDKKLFFMMIATPLFGGVEDPGQDMFGVNEFQEELPDVDDRVQYEPMRAGSVVDDRFGPAEIKQETADVDAPMAEPHMSAEPQGRVTRSQTAPAQAIQDPPVNVDLEDNLEDINLDDEPEEVRNQIRANELSRRISRFQSRERKRNNPPKVKTPKPPKKPVLETNAYGWAYNNTILIRPTFEVFWYNMNRRRGLRL
jgi:hypothetical protein